MVKYIPTWKDDLLSIPTSRNIPIAICSVVLDEGPRVFSRLVNYGEIEKVPYDAPVHVVWLQDDERGCTIMGWKWIRFRA